MKTLNLTFVFVFLSFFSISCQTESIPEIMHEESKLKNLNSLHCEKKLVLQFDSEDLVINFGQGWQNQSIGTFQLTWLNDNSLKIKSFYAINGASMQQVSAYSNQNYLISHINSFEIIVTLNDPSLWFIYGENYHLFKINLILDYCKPNQTLSKR